MGKRNFKKGKKGGKKNNGERSAKRADYVDIVKENENYENYYKGQQCFDVSEMQTMMDTFRTPLPATFRITGYKNDARQLLKNMKKVHFEGMKGMKIAGEEIKTPTLLDWYPDEMGWQTYFSRMQLRSHPPLSSFHKFCISEAEAGYITRQEAVSMIPPLLMDIKPHHKVLDMCAAPGSKTAQLVEMLHKSSGDEMPAGIVIANDKDNKRCYMLCHQIQRLNSPCSLIVNHDAANFPEIHVKNDSGVETKLRYDRILCDVPCSGDGTLRKNTDIWKTWKTQNAMFLHGTQLRILIRGLELLEVGGTLVYSTCSINPIEDEAVVAAALDKCQNTIELVDTSVPGLKFSPGVSSWKVMDKQLRWHEGYDVIKEDERKGICKSMFPPEGAKEMKLERCMRFLPHHQDTGGFFVAVIRKTAPLPWQKEKAPEEKTESKTDEKTEEKPTYFRKKPRWIDGFAEDPFVFFTEDQKDIVDSIKSFYKIRDDFPDKQLLCRSHQSKKKKLYFVSALCKNVLQSNIDYIKIINTGVRMFSRCDNTHENVKCDFRIVQDGNDWLMNYLKEDSRVVDVDMKDMSNLLSCEQPKFDSLSEDFITRLKQQDVGSLILKFVPSKEDDIEISFLVSAWRGQNACRLYLSRHERIHHLYLINKPISEYLQLNKNTYNKKNDNKQAENDNNGKKVEAAGEGSPDSKKAKLSGQDENGAQNENTAK